MLPSLSTSITPPRTSTTSTHARITAGFLIPRIDTANRTARLSPFRIAKENFGIALFVQPLAQPHQFIVYSQQLLKSIVVDHHMSPMMCSPFAGKNFGIGLQRSLSVVQAPEVQHDL
jgi:hypothetical protein